MPQFLVQYLLTQNFPAWRQGPMIGKDEMPEGAGLGSSSSVVLGISLASTSAEGQQSLLLPWWHVAKIWDHTVIAEAASARNGRPSQGLVKKHACLMKAFSRDERSKLPYWIHQECWLSCEYSLCWGNRLEEQEALRNWSQTTGKVATCGVLPCTRRHVFFLLWHKLHGC